MIELKFRVWDPKQSKLEYFDLHNITVSDNLLCQEKYPVQQFTGLQDSKGKDIYEGDIIKFSYNDKKDFYGEVIWLDDRASFGVKTGNAFQTFEDLMEYMERVEVVGNTYEPPCNPDHNGECLVCDEWLTNCPFRVDKNKE